MVVVDSLAPIWCPDMNENMTIFIPENAFQNVTCKMTAIFPRLQRVKLYFLA